MSRQRINRLCQSVLPPAFEHIRQMLPKLQGFLEQNLPTPVNQAVTCLSIDRDEIVIAANSPLVTNYLRLHSDEIRQQLRETFDLQQSLKFRSLPDSMSTLPPVGERAPPVPVSAESVAAIKRNAQWIEDEDLKAAMLSLAESLSDS